MKNAPISSRHGSRKGKISFFRADIISLQNAGFKQNNCARSSQGGKGQAEPALFEQNYFRALMTASAFAMNSSPLTWPMNSFAISL